jgi:hypothetical protein
MSKAEQILNKISQASCAKAHYEYFVRTICLLTSFPYHPYISKGEPHIYSQAQQAG